MKAFYVRDKEAEGHEESFPEIVFAETTAKAKFNSQAYAYGVPWTSIRVTREPKLDQYGSADLIPDHVLSAHGWYRA